MASNRALLYYGYAVSPGWLLEEATRRGIQSDRPYVDICRMCGTILVEAGLFAVALPIRVSAFPDGGDPATMYWCFALASTNRRDHLPKPRGKGKRPVPEESYQLLKQKLGLDHEPCWYPRAL